MSTTKQIAVKDLEPYALITDDVTGNVIAVSDVWDQTESNLGIVVKGQTVEVVKEWSRRYMNPDEKVTVITSTDERNG